MFAIDINLFPPSTGGIKLLIVLCFENNFIVNLKFSLKFRCYITVRKFGLSSTRWWTSEMKYLKYVCNFLWLAFNMSLTHLQISKKRVFIFSIDTNFGKHRKIRHVAISRAHILYGIQDFCRCIAWFLLKSDNRSIFIIKKTLAKDKFQHS